jgi:hypothetical protein
MTLYMYMYIHIAMNSRAYLLPCTGLPLGPVTWAASGPLAPWMTMNSTLSPSPTLRRYFLGLFFIIAVYTNKWTQSTIAGFISGFRSRGGKHIAANFKGGGGQPHIKYTESQFPRGGKSIQRGGGRKHSLAPPWNKRLIHTHVHTTYLTWCTKMSSLLSSLHVQNNKIIATH